MMRKILLTVMLAAAVLVPAAPGFAQEGNDEFLHPLSRADAGYLAAIQDKAGVYQVVVSAAREATKFFIPISIILVFGFIPLLAVGIALGQLKPLQIFVSLCGATIVILSGAIESFIWMVDQH